MLPSTHNDNRMHTKIDYPERTQHTKEMRREIAQALGAAISKADVEEVRGIIDRVSGPHSKESTIVSFEVPSFQDAKGNASIHHVAYALIRIPTPVEIESLKSIALILFTDHRLSDGHLSFSAQEQGRQWMPLWDFVNDQDKTCRDIAISCPFTLPALLGSITAHLNEQREKTEYQKSPARAAERERRDLSIALERERLMRGGPIFEQRNSTNTIKEKPTPRI